jgi:FkbM family methyltransferase
MQRCSFLLGTGEGAPRFVLDLDESHPHDALILRFVRAQRPYEPEVYRLLRTVLREGDTVLDVGAHIGFFTSMAGRLVGAGGRVVAFEPDAASQGRLRHHVRLNELANVTLIEQPASDRPGEVDFFVHTAGSGGNALWDPAIFPTNVGSPVRTQVQRVVATTLDAEVKRLGLATPKLIKIDTEGAEQKVLKGALGLLAGCTVPFVVCELHEFGLRQLGSSQESLRGFMQSLGYSTFTLFGSGGIPKLIPPATLIRSKFIVNVLFSTVDSVARCWPVEFVEARQAH